MRKDFANYAINIDSLCAIMCDVFADIVYWYVYIWQSVGFHY